MDCWTFMKCPEKTYKTCPAYPDKGLDCWKITGTKCDQGMHKKETVSEKIAHCRTCEFYIQFAHKF